MSKNDQELFDTFLMLIAPSKKVMVQNVLFSRYLDENAIVARVLNKLDKAKRFNLPSPTKGVSRKAKTNKSFRERIAACLPSPRDAPQIHSGEFKSAFLVDVCA